MAVMASEGSNERFLETRPDSDIQDEPQNCCERVRDEVQQCCERARYCLLSVVGRRPEPREVPRRAVNLPLGNSFPSIISSGSESSVLGSQSIVSIPTTQSRVTNPRLSGIVPAQFISNATLKLWIRDACNFQNLGGNSDLFIDAEVGNACYSTQYIKPDKMPAWGAARKFAFKLDPGDLEVVFKLFTARSDTPLGMAVMPISLCVPGKAVSFRFSLASPKHHGAQVSGEINVEAFLEPARTLVYEESSYVLVLNSKKLWQSAIVKEFTEKAKIQETTDASKRWEVSAGSVLVKKSNGRVWIKPEEQSTKLRQPYDWVCLRRGLELPERHVCVNSVEGVYVGRNEFGEIGGIKASDQLGKAHMDNLSCHGHEVSWFAEALVVRRGFLTSWKKIKQGDELPECAVWSFLPSSPSEFYGCVARNSSGEVGLLIVSESEEEGTRKMKEIRSYSKAASTEGEVLVVEMSDSRYSEFDLVIDSVENLKDPRYRVGDMALAGFRGITGVARAYHPYIKVTVSGATLNAYGDSWTSAPKSSTDRLDIHECLRLVVAEGDNLNDVKISITAYNKSARAGIRGDPDFGNGSLELTMQSLGSPHDVELQRDDVPHVCGNVKVRVRELSSSQGEIEDTPLIEVLPASANLTTIDKNMLIDKVCRNAEGDKKYRATLEVCLESLLSTTGGILIVAGVDADVRLPRLADGLALERADARCDVDKLDTFKELLNLVSTSASPAETWSDKDLESLRGVTSDVEKAIELLDGRPKGGCMILSKTGTIEDVAATFEFHGCCPYRLPCLTLEARHCMALRIVHWMSASKSKGVVFARWEHTESGDIYVAIPSLHGEAPQVFLLNKLK